MRLDGKTIIVTGSTTGIGKAIAKAAIAEGANVLIHGLEPDLGEQAIEDLNPDRSQVSLCILDLTTDGAPKQLIQTAIDEFGKFDALVNNAAWVGTGNINDTDEAKFEMAMAINAKAPFFLIKAAIPQLAAQKGSVLNIGSVNANCGEAELLPYSMSKGALQTMTRNLGDTLHREHGIRVNQINPGWVLTENEQARKHEQGMDEDWPSALPSMFAPSSRIFAPEEIAAAAVYFLSNESGPISGSILEIEQYPMIGRNPPKC
tara:strand:- start:1432 stop:2214 length:783 start_codon:yes stop_codon:yes gene_type:complete